MTGQTPNHHIRFPEMTDRANITIVQQMSEDVEREAKVLADSLQAQTADKVKWERIIGWRPTLGGLNLGNGTLIPNAFRLGKLIWIDIAVFSAAAPTVPTTAWPTGNVFSTFSLPAPAAAPNIVRCWHYPGTGSGVIRNLIMTVSGNQDTVVAVQGLVLGQNASFPNMDGFYAYNLHTSTGRTSPTWANSGYFFGRMFYRSS